MFERIRMLGSSISGLISGILFGIVIVSLYLLFTYNNNILPFIFPLILSIISAISFFLPKFLRISYSISGFISGILIVITAFSTLVIFLKENIIFLLIETSFVVLAFLSTFILMLTMEIRMEKKEKEEIKVPKPPYERL